MKKIILLIGLMLASTVTGAASMLPLVQSFHIPSGAVVQDNFHVENRSVNMMAVNVESNGLTILLPDGTAIDESNAASYAFTWTNSENPSNGVNTVSVTSEDAPVGDYGFIVSSDSNASVFSVTETPSPSFSTFIGSEQSTAEPGRYFAIAMALTNSGSPALGATISAEILDDDGLVLDTLQLADDGTAPDSRQNDGVYTAVSAVAQEGKYSVRYVVEWSGHKGRVVKPLRVSSSTFGLTGEFDSETVDVNGNGLVDSLKLTFIESQERDNAEHTITARLTDADGQTIDAARAVYSSNEPLSVEFSAESLKKLGEHPWTISFVGLMRIAEPLGYLTDIGTVNVDPSVIESPALTVTGVISDRGIDENDDGIFEKLEVSVEIITREAGYYGLSTDLRGSENELVSDDGKASIYLSTGSNTVTLSFLGSDIGGVGASGPFKVTNFLIYPNFNSGENVAGLMDYVGDTSGYSCSQFVGCGSDMQAEIRRIALALCTVHKKQLLAKLKQIEGMARGKPEVADHQMQGLYTRAKALEKSGSCPPATGWKGDRPLVKNAD
ncbi:choice-of-anchor X domain-containing protein [Marinobacter pelagius]|nr:choice-of-anchor X domain-containing protein [Marinobacter pelagius]